MYFRISLRLDAIKKQWLLVTLSLLVWVQHCICWSLSTDCLHTVHSHRCVNEKANFLIFYMQVSNSSKLTKSPRCWPRPKFPRSQSYQVSVGSAPEPPGTRHHRTALEVLWPYLDRSELFSPRKRNLHNIKQVVWMLWLIGVLLYMEPP